MDTNVDSQLDSIDLSRAAAIIGMILCHFVIYTSCFEQMDHLQSLLGRTRGIDLLALPLLSPLTAKRYRVLAGVPRRFEMALDSRQLKLPVSLFLPGLKSQGFQTPGGFA